ncbi:MAG: ureidoglycolate lyase [Pseudomonadota bacterium]
MREVQVAPLTPDAFAPYGEVLDRRTQPDKMINQDMCGRHHDLARLDFGPQGRAGISFFDAKPRRLPYTLEMVERHPDGSQAFIPMTETSFLVVVAPDENGRPGAPLAFLTAPGQGVNYRRGVWHGVLTPLSSPGLFAVVDRIGETKNLEEHWYSEPWRVVRAGKANR